MTLIIFIILLALLFDFLNGFHDASNSIATIVSTRVMRPHLAVLWASFFNFVAFLVFHLNVANTIGVGLISPQIIDPHLILSALVGAIIWNLVTWYFGIPSSSSHALIGGLVGAAMIKSGWHDLQMVGLLKVAVSIVLSPLLGFILGLVFIFLIAKIFFYTPPYKIDGWFRRLQFLSAAFVSLGHGGNDAQKTMGIIAVLLFSTGYIKGEFYVPWWVIISCNLIMALGTLTGGWRIVKTMGMRIYLVFSDFFRYPRFNYSYHYGRYYRRRFVKYFICCALGRCKAHRLGVDSYLACCGGSGGSDECDVEEMGNLAGFSSLRLRA